MDRQSVPDSCGCDRKRATANGCGGVGRYVGFTPVWERTICGFRAGEAWGAQRTCFVDAKVADWRRNLDRHAIAGRNGV